MVSTIQDVLTGRAKWCVITGDCLDVLRTIPAGSVDAVVTDPPYGETSLGWDRIVKGWAVRIADVLSTSGSMWVWGSLRSFLLSAEEFSGWKFAQDVVWEKHNGSGFQDDRFKRVHEIAAQWYRGPWASVFKAPQYTNDATKRTVRRKHRPPHLGDIDGHTFTAEDGGPRLMRSVLHVRSCHGYADHPTQKPVGVLTPLIEFSCPEDAIVIDPFCGSGSTGVAAMLSGRRFIGIEADDKFACIARARIAEAANHLFAERNP